MQINSFAKTIIIFIFINLTFQTIANGQGAKELRIGYQKYGDLILLKTRGTLDKRLAKDNIKIKWIEFPAGPQLIEGLNAGGIDLGSVGETPPIFAQAANVNIVYVANEIPAPKSEAILVPEDSPIKSMADLKGKKVAFNKGSNVHYLLVKALEEAGLKYSDIRPIYLTSSDARVAFESKQIDAWVIWDPYQAAAEIQTKARTLRNGVGLVDNHEFYIANGSYAQQNPQILKAVVEELQKLSEWPTHNPQEVSETIAAILGLPKEITHLAVIRKTYGTKYITPDVIDRQQKVADTFYNLKLIPKKIIINEIIWSPNDAENIHNQSINTN